MSRGDKLIFIFTLIFSVFLIIFSNNISGSSVKKSVIIEVDGEIYGKYDLGDEKSTKSLEINTKYGYNNVVVEYDGVYVASSSCPDGLEVKQGKIERPGEMLVCLPNRLVIRIEGESEVDSVAY